jgi:hypothetical protein
MRVLIGGSRYITNPKALEAALQSAAAEIPDFKVAEVVSGKAAGADKLGEDWAAANGVPVKSFSADWNDLQAPGAVVRYDRAGRPYNAKAGPDRNRRMAAYADVGVFLWDGASRGTADAIRQMKALGKPVVVHLVY